MTWITIIGKYGWRKVQSLKLAACITRFTIVLLAAIVGLCSSPPNVLADTHYVSLSGGNVSPYTSWGTAATNIQYAIDVSTSGDIVLVTNGVYATGGRVVYGAMTNRVAITKSVTVQSVNGPDLTVIIGQGPAGNSAVRCAYVGTNATLSGFTLTNGFTRASGDSYAEQSGGGAWCETNAVISNCLIVGSAASYYGGGVYDGNIYDSTISTNIANYGGGAYGAILSRCVIKKNSASNGGGTYGGAILNCFLSGNYASSFGGGAWGGTIRNCTIVGNAASMNGGGVYLRGTSVANSIIYFNDGQSQANLSASGSTSVSYCCTTPLPSTGDGNIEVEPALVSPDNPHLMPMSPCIDRGGSFYVGGNTDIDGEPRTSGGSPDIGCDEFMLSGCGGMITTAIITEYTNAVAGATLLFDSLIQGKVLGYTWSLGDGSCESNISLVEHCFANAGDFVVTLTVSNLDNAVSCTTSVHVLPAVTNVFVSPTGSDVWPYNTWATATHTIQNAIDAAPSNLPGVIIAVSEGIYQQGGYTNQSGASRIGLYKPVTVKAAGSDPQLYVIRGDTNTRCAYVGPGALLLGLTLEGGSIGSQNGGGAWCDNYGALLNCLIRNNSALVTNQYIQYGSGGGVYCSDKGHVTDCTIVSNIAANGGGTYGGRVRCCLISSNMAWHSGGGTYGGIIERCMIISNQSLTSYGGGSYAGTLQNCFIFGNIAYAGGGGASGCTVINCTVTCNMAIFPPDTGGSAVGGGGISYSTVRNSIIMYNTFDGGDPSWQNWNANGLCEYSCVYPLAAGAGNFADDPGLLAKSNPHLLNHSSCIDAGCNIYAPPGLDIDGDYRFSAGKVDVGCDEYVAASLSGNLQAGMFAIYTNATVGASLPFESTSLGHASAQYWNWGDGSCLDETQHTIVAHAYAAPGEYTVTLCVSNLDCMSVATIAVHIVSDYTIYVDSHGTEVPPFTNWATAAKTVQVAISNAPPILGGTILVTAGTNGSKANTVRIDKPLCVSAVSGPSSTVIYGSTYVGRNARLSGFTVTGGSTNYGGGVWCDTEGIVSNCIIVGNSANQLGGGVYGGTYYDCLLMSNTVVWGGGGAACATLFRCTLMNNTSGEYGRGGGAYACILNQCFVSGNIVIYDGGGCSYCTLRNCSVLSNYAQNAGGGMAGGIAYNCDIRGNFAFRGGGACGGTLYNSTLVGNTALTYGGGIAGSSVFNSIIYDNQSYDGGNNYYADPDIHIAYSCTTPAPGGQGNITDNPRLVSSSGSHLLQSSSCIDAGCNIFVTEATDIEGDPRINGTAVDMGCDEFAYASMTGILQVAISTPATSVVQGTKIEFQSVFVGPISGYTWDWGDGTTSNDLALGHTFSTAGDYRVVLNGSNAAGNVQSAITVHVVEAFTNYVSLSGMSLFPYTNWLNAATNIQDAIDAAPAGGVVLVAPAVYGRDSRNYGGMANRVVVCKPLTVLASSTNRAFTVIQGQGPLGANAVRCAYVGNGARLMGFTLTNGFTKTLGDYIQQQSGGGAFCEADGVISNCEVIGNHASYSGGGIIGGTVQASLLLGNLVTSSLISGNFSGLGGGAFSTMISDSSLIGNAARAGGGAYGSRLDRCTLAMNTATNYGGGVLYSTVSCSTISSNTATYGGGAFDSDVMLSMIAGNSASSDGGGAYGGTLSSCLVIGNSARASCGGVGSSVVDGSTVVGNTAGTTGGGGGGTLHNCIIYHNTAPSSPDIVGSIMDYCCTPGGWITNSPGFQDEANGNYRLNANSPCIDAGANQAWMFTSLDLDGNSRIVNGRVDIGAYEFHFDTSIQVLLQGPYKTNLHAMIAAHSNSLPYTAPYAADPVCVSEIPSNVTDWVLVQVRPGPTNAPIYAQSAFLRDDGSVLSAAGTTQLVVEVSPGTTNYLTISHRNHLVAMSALPIVFTNQALQYSFTTGSTQYYGGTNGTVLLEPGVWGMISGNADGDGEIQAADLAIWTTQSNRTGYLRSDTSLDGVVDSTDRALIQANIGRKSPVPNSDVVLTSNLKVAPDRKTVLQGDGTGLSAGGTTGAVYWTFIQNGSGGSLLTNSTSSAIHTAGLNSSTVDVVQAWDAYNNLGRTYLNVIGSNEVAALGKAVIIAGGKSLDDIIWPATDYLANKGYNMLRYRGFSKENINYLSFQPGRDIDGNGQDDDIDGYSSSANASSAFTNWATHANKLFVYLVDHGSESAGQGYFRLNGGEVLSATNLNVWLTKIQNTYTTEVTVVMDFCYSGTFLSALAYTGAAKRVVMAATASDELTYFLSDGYVSFSAEFWNGMLQGLDLSGSFALARDSMASYQHAQLDDNGSGTYQPGVDGVACANIFIGATFVAGKNFPIIGQVLGTQLLTDETAATLYAADINSYYPIEDVWCTIIPPSYSPATNSGIPVVDIAEVHLSYDEQSRRYQSSFEGFTESGTYQINYYAKDYWQSVSPPRASQVIQAGYRDKLLIVAGGPTNDARWPAISYLADQAYVTARVRAFTTNTIFFLSAQAAHDANHDGTNDVNAVVSLAQLSNAITNWATNANRLIVYLVGGTSNSLFRLNETQTMSAVQLDAMLDQLQVSNTAVNVLMEFDGSGDYLSLLMPPSDRERINITCVASNQPVQWGRDGVISFSQCFFSSVFQGESIGDAYLKAYDAIGNMLGQKARLDDNGDGIPEVVKNFRTSSTALSKRRYWGPAFVTGDDKPVIGNKIPDTLLPAATSMVIWVSDILDTSGITNVWCAVSPPDARGTNGLIYQTMSFNPASSRYETTQTFSQAGTYSLTFFAQNGKGDLSPPTQTSVITPDAYETDNTSGQASFMDVGDVQYSHNFHTATDEDWIRFYLPATGKVFNVIATQQGTNSDLAMDIYFQRPDGTLSNLYMGIDDAADGIGETEDAVLDFQMNPALQEGFYLARIYPAVASTWGVGSEYDVTVVTTVGGGNLIVAAVNKLASPSAPPPGARAVLDNTVTQVFGAATSVTLLNVAAGTHSLRVDVNAGYAPSEDPTTPNQVVNPSSVQYGNPKNKTVADNTWQSTTFQFMPVITAQGQVRDQFTGEYVSGAKIAFIATSGLINTQVYDGYPNFATYKTNWYTGRDGTFPSNVILPAVDWNLRLTKSGYATNLTVSAIASPVAGQTYSQSVRWMIPVDSNGNQIADSWEQQYFGTNTVVATADSDHDGQSNLNEYRSGTNPTNAASVFRASQAAATNNLTLVWLVASGRSYQVEAATILPTGGWSTVAGPWTATNGQATMQWNPSMVTTIQAFRVRMSTP